MSDVLWPLGAMVVAALLAHIPISWIVNSLYDSLHWPSTSKRLPALVGVIERTLFVSALLIERPEFIAVWLALKVAGQWQGWNLGKPDHEPPIEGRDLFNIFLIGSGLSIGYSALAVTLMHWGMDCHWGKVSIASGAAIVATVILGLVVRSPSTKAAPSAAVNSPGHG